MEQLRMVIDRDSDETHVRVAGELDIATVPQLEVGLAALQAKESIVVDLDQVGFMDSSGLSALLKLVNRSQVQGGRLRIVCRSRPVLRLFEVAGLLHLLEPAR